MRCLANKTFSAFFLLVLICGGVAFSQDQSAAEPNAAEPNAAVTSTDPENQVPTVPNAVSVEAVVEDGDIENRLLRILEATEWFERAAVRVDDGVVFLTGTADSDEHKRWAAELAGKTEDVVAVVNRMQITEPPLLDLDPATSVLKDLARNAIGALPMIGIAIVILGLTWVATILAVKLADITFLKRIDSSLLREVMRKATAAPVIVLGLYLVLLVSGLSRLAVTVIGGTGLFGLVLGVAFRDIMENFLSSILISIQHPFKYGDLIEVDGHTGYVQRVNTRGTLLMTFEGNHIQIPNSTIYKSVIQNFTSNPNQRFDFVVGIGYDSSVAEAQEIAMNVLKEHSAVLNDPPASVLVDELGSSTVNLRCYFWVDGHQHSGLKVKSSVIRQVMRSLEQAKISMPDDAREIVFPHGVPVQLSKEHHDDSDHDSSLSTEKDKQALSTDSEGDFRSDASKIEEQARASRDPEQDDADLLNGSQSEGKATERQFATT